MTVRNQMRADLARDAIAAASRLRRTEKIGTGEPVSIFDVTQSLGIELRFVARPSLEALYSRAPRPTIVVSSLRPAGRQRYGCAHEVGHHVFGHGLCINEFTSGNAQLEFDEREFLAETFAGAFLMPKSSLTHALKRRNWDVEDLTPEDLFKLSGWFGVGYSTLIHHLRSGLRLMSTQKAAALLRTPVVRVKQTLAGRRVSDDLVVLDRFWDQRSLEVSVGDVIVAFQELQAQGAALALDPEKHALIACQPGLGHVRANDWSVSVRVARRHYVGRGCYRHLEEVA